MKLRVLISINILLITGASAQQNRIEKFEQSAGEKETIASKDSNFFSSAFEKIEKIPENVKTFVKDRKEDVTTVVKQTPVYKGVSTVASKVSVKLQKLGQGPSTFPFKSSTSEIKEQEASDLQKLGLKNSLLEKKLQIQQKLGLVPQGKEKALSSQINILRNSRLLFVENKIKEYSKIEEAKADRVKRLEASIEKLQKASAGPLSKSSQDKIMQLQSEVKKLKSNIEDAQAFREAYEVNRSLITNMTDKELSTMVALERDIQELKSKNSQLVDEAEKNDAILCRELGISGNEKENMTAILINEMRARNLALEELNKNKEKLAQEQNKNQDKEKISKLKKEIKNNEKELEDAQKKFDSKMDELQINPNKLRAWYEGRVNNKALQEKDKIDARLKELQLEHKELDTIVKERIKTAGSLGASASQERVPSVIRSIPEIPSTPPPPPVDKVPEMPLVPPPPVGTAPLIPLTPPPPPVDKVPEIPSTPPPPPVGEKDDNLP